MTQSQFVEGPGWKIHYTVQGDGPPVVLLHGGGPGASGMSNYSKNLEALSREYTCYTIDFPGWAGSSKNLAVFNGESPFHSGGRAVMAFMNALKIERAHLIGNSFGGSAAICAAIDHPHRVDKLVLMGPGGGVVPGAKGPTQGIVQLLTYYAGEGPTLEKMGAFLKNLVFDQSVLTPELIQQRFEASNHPDLLRSPPLTLPPAGAPPVSPAMFVSQDPRLKDLEHQALFVWGLQDVVNPWEGMHGFRAMPHADFVLFSQCGHWAQWEHAAKFNSLVLSFLARP